MVAKCTVKIKTSWKPTLWQTEHWDENRMKIKQKSSRKHSHIRRGDRKHWANCCCVFNDNHKKTHNPFFFPPLGSLVEAFKSRMVGYWSQDNKITSLTVSSLTKFYVSLMPTHSCQQQPFSLKPSRCFRFDAPQTMPLPGGEIGNHCVC